MSKVVYNKLVRDNIPEIIKADGRIPETSVLSSEQLDIALDRKLLEEVNEFLESHNEEEMADVIEVLVAISKRHGISMQKAESLRTSKRNERGGFDKGILLHSVSER